MKVQLFIRIAERCVWVLFERDGGCLLETIQTSGHSKWKFHMLHVPVYYFEEYDQVLLMWLVSRGLLQGAGLYRGINRCWMRARLKGILWAC